MANCTYTFTDGTTIKGIPALKAFLVNGGLDTYLPERAMEMQGPSASRAQPLTPEDVLKPETIAKAEAAIAQYKKAEPPDPLTTKQRADGERLLEPMFEAARRNKDAFDATLDRIGESVNGFAKKAGIKKPYRAVTKLVLEKEGLAAKMKDLLRGTIVVNSLEDVQNAIDEVSKVYELTLLKNRLSISVNNGKGETVKGEPLSTGYQDVLTNVALPDGTLAEIQISTPEMAAAKSLGHQIFSFEREMPESPIKSRMVEIQKQIYSEGFAASEIKAANASKTLSNSALSTGSAFSRTSEGLRGLGSGTQAVAERQSGETVTGTSSQSKNMVPGGKDLKSNFIRTSDPIIPESRAYASAQIAFSPRQRFTLQDETYTKTVQRNLQDYFARVADVQGALSAQGGKVGEAQNVYLAEELSYGRLQEQMVDFKEDMLKPLIKEAKAAGLELSDLALYAYAKHAPERNQAIAARNKTFGKGEGSGMTTSEANNIMRAFKAEGKDTALANLHDKLMQITQATRLVLLSEGLITQDQFDSLQRQYSDYVPLRGFTEDEDLESGRPVAGPRVGGRGFNIRGKETMRALGRESRAGHIIENIVIDYERAIARSERNNVAKVFLDLATTNPDPGLWEIDAQRTKAAFDRATGMVKYNTLIDKGEDTISVKIDGNEIYIKIKDPLLLRAMRNAGKDETGAIDRVLAMTIGRYTALMRNTLTRYNPAFGFTNAVKDLGFGAVSALSDLGPKGAAMFFKNYANPVQSGQMFEEFRAAGATTGGWHIRDQQEMQKELQRLVEWEGGSSIKSTAYSMGKATLDALEFIGQYSETQARFAAYKAARQLNKSPADAASIAKNLTTNFNRRGEWGSAMNTMYLFFNAGVQGSVKTVKNLRSPYVMAAMAGLSGMAAGLAFMGAGVGGDDDDGEAYWDKIPQFEKERNLIVMLPPGEGMLVKGETKVGKNGRYLKLPIQYGINVFSTLGYQIADLARYTQNHSRGVSPAKAATNMVSVTFGSFNPFGGGFDPSKPAEVALAVSPSVVDLGVQALMGVNSFGTPVAPRKYDDNKPDAENFGPGMAGTWEQRLARWLSESTGGDRAVGGAIDVSPGSIRNIVRNLTGGTGDFLTSVFVNIPSKMWSPEGEVGPRDVPVLKAFYGEVDEVTDSKLFYERKAEVLEAAKQASDRQKLGIEVEYDDKSRGLQSLGNAAKSYTEKMTQLRKQELKVAEDSGLTEAQKNTERKSIQKERAQVASEFNALYYGMKKDLAAVK